jgi:hypothetical protein
MEAARELFKASATAYNVWIKGSVKKSDQENARSGKGKTGRSRNAFLRGLGVFRKAMIAKSIERLGDGQVLLRGVGREPCAGEGGKLFGM